MEPFTVRVQPQRFNAGVEIDALSGNRPAARWSASAAWCAITATAAM